MEGEGGGLVRPRGRSVLHASRTSLARCFGPAMFYETAEWGGNIPCKVTCQSSIKHALLEEEEEEEEEKELWKSLPDASALRYVFAHPAR